MIAPAPASARTRRNPFAGLASLAIPFAVASLVATAAYAGADTTFTPALTKFTYRFCSVYVP